MERLQKSFYHRTDVLQIAQELLGKRLVTCFEGVETIGIITETEAYNGVGDRASHASGGRRTKRTETMFQTGGVAYVYLCYGIHHLFNVVTGKKHHPQAVLIRAIEPVQGIDKMLERCKKEKGTKKMTTGPGKLTKALGISTLQNGVDLVSGNEIWIAPGSSVIAQNEIESSPRIGVDYAGEDALLPYRFTMKGNSFLSQ